MAQKKTAKRSPAKTRRRGPAQQKKLKALAAMMRGIDLCMMATKAKDGSFHVRPMSNNGKVDFDGDAWFFTRRDTFKVRELENEPRVSLSYIGGTKRAPVWIAVSGTASIVDDEATKAEKWVKSLSRWFEKGPEDPSVVLIRVEAKRANWWSYDGEGEVTLG